MQPNYYHARINPSCMKASFDWQLFMNDMTITNQGKWDKDHKGKIVAGDYLGFIIGEKGEEVVKIFKVKEELPLNQRESWWSEKAYTENNGVNSTKHRVPILLTNQHELPKTWAWSDIKKNVGLSPNCSTWMPRGTQRVANSNLLPFVLTTAAAASDDEDIAEQFNYNWRPPAFN